MKRPVGASRVVAGFQDQAVLVQLPDFPSGDGVFKLTVTSGAHDDGRQRRVVRRVQASKPQATKLLAALVFIAAIVLLTLWRAGLIDLA